jgi:hypothetical protein
LKLFKRILFFINFIILFINIGVSQNYKITHYGVKEGMSSNCVYHCTQDSLGLIWFATDNGLTRFDGKKFKYFGITDGLSTNEVYYIKGLGNKLFCYNSNEIQIILNQKIKYFSNASNVFKHFFIESIDSLLIVSNYDSLFYFNLNTNKLEECIKIKYPIVFKNENGIIIRKSLDDVLNIGLASGKFNRVNVSNQIRNSMLFFSNDLKRAYYYNWLKKNALIINLPLETYINYCYLSNDSLLFIATKNGLYIKHIFNTNFQNVLLKAMSINTINEDINGNIWICTSNDGVYMMQKNEIEKISIGEKYTFHSINANNSTVALGGLNCSAEMEKGKLKVTKYNVNEVLYPYYWMGQNRAIFIGQHHIYFSKLDSIKFPYNIKCFSYYSMDTILIGSGVGLFFYNLKNRKLGGKMIDGRVYSLGYFNNKIWAYTEKGIALIQNRHSQYLRLIKDKDIGISNFMSDKQKNTWISTSGIGVFIIDSQNQVIKNLQEKNGLISNNCKSMFIDDKNRVWLASNKGLSCIDGLDKIRNYTESDGLPSSDIYDLEVIEDTVYVLTSLGLCKFTYTPRAQIYYFPLSITELKIGDSIYNAMPSLLEPSSNSIKLSYAGIYYEASDDIQYEYKLIYNNVDNKWIHTPDNQIAFSSLKHGNYKLMIRAYNKNDKTILSKTFVWTFKIKPYYFQTIWFFMLCVLTIGIIGLWYGYNYQNRKKKIERDRMILESKLKDITLRSLQHQMNPHFIFNSLNTIQYFISTENEIDANIYLSSFSQLMRDMLENIKRELITLHAEIEFNKRYAELELMRYQNKFDIEFNIMLDNTEDILIPTMLIQPLIENAIKHGVSNLKNKRGKIEINFYNKSIDLLQIDVKDNGTYTPRTNSKPNYKSTAMNVIKERLALYSKNNCSGEFSIQFNTENTVATIVIPY